MKNGIIAKPSFNQYMLDNKIMNRQIEKATGISEKTVSNFRTRKSCSMGTAILIARELELELYDIIERR